MTKIVKILNKYIILLIISSVLGLPWFYIRLAFFINYESNSAIDLIPRYVDYLIRLIVIILLIIDFKKYQLKYILVTCIAALFFPLLGVVTFAIILLEREKNKANI